MKKTKHLFSGTCTALTTPFKNEKIDWETLESHMEWQISEGIDALCLCGTTGEAGTLTAKEKKEIIKRGYEIIGKRVPYIVGTGTNSTASAVAWSYYAAECGADGLLLVTPYYNKGTEEGVVQHYRAIARAVDVPQIVYHVPSRTGVRLSVAQMAELSEENNIVAVKEADPDMDRALDVMRAVEGKMDVYCGNDSLAIPMICMGGIGLISVISNILPREMCGIVHECLEGNVKKAREAMMRLLPLMRLMTARTNPAPVKCAMSLSGFGTGELRLPMAPVPRDIAEKIADAMGML